MPDAICGLPTFPRPVTGIFHLLISKLLCHAVTLDVDNLSCKLERCMAFRCELTVGTRNRQMQRVMWLKGTAA